MRISLYRDIDMPIDLDGLSLVVSNAATYSTARAPGSYVTFRDTIQPDKAYAQLDSLIAEETQDDDLILVFTEVPYSNNFFFETQGRFVIVSLYAWGHLTDLPMANGAMFFCAELMLLSMVPGYRHQATTGCVFDFKGDKTAVDDAMRRGAICEECESRLARATPSQTARETVEDARNLLRVVGEASRRSASVTSRSILKEAKLERSKKKKVRKNIQHEANVAEGDGSEFDVFLCHNSEDKPAVKVVAQRLEGAGLKPWLDEWNLRPGRPWQDALEQTIPRIRSAAVFVGANGIGPWQNMELAAFLREFINRSCPVIPVLLSDCLEPPRLPVFLSGMTWVDLAKDEPDPFDQLTWGITGISPHRPSRGP